MRHGRAKQSRRTLQFYRLNAPHIKPPYKILLDGTFLVASIRNKVPLWDRFAKTLQNEEFICCVTRSTLVELEKLADAKGKQIIDNGDNADNSEDQRDNINFFAQARRFGLDECEIIEGHNNNKVVPTPTTEKETDNSNKKYKKNDPFRDFSDASREIYTLATTDGNNKQSYFVATQDDALADALRSMPYVPLFRLGRAVLLLESPSSASRSYTGNLERKKLNSAGGLMTEEERKMVDTIRKKDRKKQKEQHREEQKKLEKRQRDEVGGGFNGRRKKKAKGPNPLSCKKKK